MKDYIISGTAFENQVRFFATTSKDTVETARQNHNLSPLATVALGRLLSAGAMMGSMCKNDKDVITIQIQCSGPIGGLTVTATPDGNVKGYVNNPDVNLPLKANNQWDVAKALDLGVLSVIKDIGMKEPYVGQTQLTTAEIAEDLTYYFATSEQIPTSVSLGVLMDKNNTVKQAGGFIIQMMPFATDDVITKLENVLKDFDGVSVCLDKGMTPEDIVLSLFGKDNYTINTKMPTQFYCSCSKEHFSKALACLGKKEIQEMVDDGEPIEVNCHFCNSKYTFEIDELKEYL